MTTFEIGYCDCDEGEITIYNPKTDKYDLKVECPDCLGTGKELTRLGLDLVEFLRGTKGKI